MAATALLVTLAVFFLAFACLSALSQAQQTQPLRLRLSQLGQLQSLPHAWCLNQQVGCSQRPWAKVVQETLRYTTPLHQLKVRRKRLYLDQLKLAHSRPAQRSHHHASLLHAPIPEPNHWV